MPPRTIVIFTGRYSSAAVTEHVEAIASRFPNWKIHVVQEKAPRRWRSYLRGKIRKQRNAVRQASGNGVRSCFALTLRCGTHSPSMRKS
jgi:hypothetical protein